MRKRFEGCLMGALLGDCLGAPFELESKQPRDKILEVISPSAIDKRRKAVRFYYTDDTAMTKSVSASLLYHNGFNAQDMAKRFAEDFKVDPERGYGGVTKIFSTWLAHGVENDVFKPGREQYGGSGSYGNGAAMRVAPVALFCNNENDVAQMAKQQALLTHSAVHGYHGAILQALAIHKALRCEKPLNVNLYLDALISFMTSLEQETTRDVVDKNEDPPEKEDVKWSRSKSFSFVGQLNKIKELLDEKCKDTDRVVELLGHDITAQESVPAAIYSFLCNARESFEETIYFAISLGGDTDTVATMAGAIAGAYFDISNIPKRWILSCEFSGETRDVANRLYERQSESSKQQKEKNDC